MWWVWREKVELLIDVGVVRVLRQGCGEVCLEHPASLPLADVLAQVNEACERSKGRPWRLHVSLGAALCPVTSLDLPQGVERGSETMAVARASAAQAWGFPPEQAHELDCAVDPQRKSEVAALLAATHQQIREWAALHGGRLASLVPAAAGPYGATLQFVPSRASAIAWRFAGMWLLCLAVFTGWQVWQQHSVQRTLQTELARLQADLQARSVTAAPAVNLREASERSAWRLMQRDWNRLYDTIESAELTAVRMVQLSFEAETGDARLEIELDPVGQSSDVTAALNRNETPGTWRVESIVATGGTAIASPFAGTRLRGVWRARLE
ncbi:hypothetical protein [Hydrogenophaga sp. BPS33]|uniref:hypothetical protein n=1 Tax=Hydrogenophaga sp. BPS33 TaxID=2651974 RepID=UPI00131F6206|nr:hypothetical protein [Hydrogenophaga sp. BPS33]QHE86651.1 hypothetical protein F9K07_17970 [Hydrogenophaga sp. BPS33]